jgi:benzoylformate decarboxylase
MAQSMGVDAVKVEDPNDIQSAIDRALADDEPFLIDLTINDDVAGHVGHVVCGQ